VTDALDRVRAAVAARADAGLRRVLRPRHAGSDVLDLAGNDYLGLSRDPRVIEAAAEACRVWGAGSTGSRLVTGTTTEHETLEAELAAFLSEPTAATTGMAPTATPGARGGSADAKGLVFSSGYLANVGVLTALGGPDVTVISDAGNHASIIDGCRLSGSPVTVVPHRDIDKIDAALAAADTEHALVVTDAVFSVDGDLAPLRAVHAATRRHGAILVVDEAHAVGVVGDGGVGAVSAAGLSGAQDIVRTVTLSKSFGAQGGAVVSAPPVIDLLVNTARSFIFDTGLAPGSAAAARAALRVLIDEPQRAARVRQRAGQLAAVVQALGIETVAPDAAIVPAFLGDPRRAVAAAAECLDHGVHVGCFRPPSVPTGRSCLRLTARADLTDADIERAESVLRAVLR
jgi:8-amino-7-oxononanoate synthase